MNVFSFLRICLFCVIYVILEYNGTFELFGFLLEYFECQNELKIRECSYLFTVHLNLQTVEAKHIQQHLIRPSYSPNIPKEQPMKSESNEINAKDSENE